MQRVYNSVYMPAPVGAPTKSSRRVVSDTPMRSEIRCNLDKEILICEVLFVTALITHHSAVEVFWV